MNDMKGKLITILMATLVLMVGTFVISIAAPNIEQSIPDLKPITTSDYIKAGLILIIWIFVGLVFYYIQGGIV